MTVTGQIIPGKMDFLAVLKEDWNSVPLSLVAVENEC